MTAVAFDTLKIAQALRDKAKLRLIRLRVYHKLLRKLQESNL
jgi:hypothetical protein